MAARYTSLFIGSGNIYKDWISNQLLLLYPTYTIYTKKRQNTGNQKNLNMPVEAEHITPTMQRKKKP